MKAWVLELQWGEKLDKALQQSKATGTEVLRCLSKSKEIYVKKNIDFNFPEIVNC